MSWRTRARAARVSPVGAHPQAKRSPTRGSARILESVFLHALVMRSAIACAALVLTAAACARGGAAPAAAVSVETAELPIAPDSTAARLLDDIRAHDTTVVVAMRYATSDNFTGAPLPGYEANRAFLRREAAAALARAQHAALSEGFKLKIFDAYRPRRATLAMVDWTARTGRDHLIRDGYIARRSRHNLGLAVDVTLVDAATGAELDMGSPFDTFSALSRTANATGAVAANRARLVRLMESAGWKNYAEEWWHFSFDLPGARPFDFVVR